ncbi:MAG: DUF885 domain-containing protein [Planctomycetota bacterium]|jgi:uncharacterized protein (DUF885 family)
MLISSLLLANLAALPQDVTVSLEPRSGPASVVRQGADYLLRVRSNLDREIKTAVEVWVSPEIAIRGLPGGLRLNRRESAEFPCTVHVEADRPAGTVQLRLILRRAGGTERLGHVRVPLHVAVGRDFLRLSFEDGREGISLDGAEPVPAGGWQARIVDSNAAHGRSFLRLTGGGGDGSGRHSLLAPSALSFDTGQFPYLTFWSRGKGKGRAVLSLRVGARQVSLPLQLSNDWRRVVVDLDKKLQAALGRGRHRVSAIAVRGSASDDGATLDLDEFAIVRRPERTMGDRLRGLIARHRRTLRPGEIDVLKRDLGKIDAGKLAAQELVDYELLRHDLSWQQTRRTLPRKRARKPAGKPRFEAMLQHVHHLDRDSAELRRLGERQIRLHQQMLDALARQIAPGKGWRDVAEMLKGKHPAAAELPKFARWAMQRAMDFTIANDLVTVPHAARDARIRVITSGQLSRTYPFGGYGGARPSRTGFTGTYFVSPPAKWMNAQQSKDRLRGNHKAKTQVVALHEVVPGHHLQTVVHRLRPLSAFRRRFYSTVFAEGWALYCEETMHKSGFFADLDTRFAQLRMRLWRAVRVVVDVGLHTGDITVAEAREMLVKEAGLDLINAKAEVQRYIDNPTRPMSYLVGFLMIDGLEAAERKRLGDGFNGRAFRDRLLAFGPVPLPAILKGIQRSIQEGRRR